MRIILLLAAAAGAAAIGTAASARPAGKPGGPPGAWAVGGGHRAIAGWQGRSRPGLARGHHHHRDRHPGRRGLAERDGVYFQDGGIAVPTAIVSPWGNGFFAAGGGEVRMRGARPRYDYDRSYPYEWAPRAGGPDAENEAIPQAPRPRCTVEYGVRVCRGW